MATNLADAVADLMRADVTLMAILVGKVYSDAGIGQAGDGKHPINPVDTPLAYADTPSGVKDLLPCAFVTLQGGADFGPGGCHQQVSVRISVHQQFGYDKTRAALERLRVVLHRKQVSLSGGPGYLLQHIDDPIMGSVDTSLVVGDGKRPASLEAGRYFGIRQW